MPWLLLIFLIVPVIEMVVVIEVGGFLGSVPTVALVFLTAVVGVYMLKQQGLTTMARFQERMVQGELPGEELFSGIFLLIAGTLLLLPGFVTDSIGFALMVPSVRERMASSLVSKGIMEMASQFQSSVFTEGAGTDIEGAATEVREAEPDRIQTQADPADDIEGSATEIDPDSSTNQQDSSPPKTDPESSDHS